MSVFNLFFLMAVFFGSLGSYGGLFRQFGFLWFGFRMLGFLWLSFSDVWILIVVLSVVWILWLSLSGFPLVPFSGFPFVPVLVFRLSPFLVFRLSPFWFSACPLSSLVPLSGFPLVPLGIFQAPEEPQSCLPSSRRALRSIFREPEVQYKTFC